MTVKKSTKAAKPAEVKIKIKAKGSPSQVKNALSKIVKK
jgi:hypothetical protein